MNAEGVDVVLVKQVRPDPRDAESDLPQDAADPDDPISRSLQTFRKMDAEFYANLEDIPAYFEGLDDDAVAHGLSVRTVRSPIQPPSRRVRNAIGIDDVLILTSMFVIALLSDRHKAAIRGWLASNSKRIWTRLVSASDPNAWRVAYVDRDGPIAQEYSLTLGVVASLPNDRLVRLLVKNDCSLEEFKLTVSLFLDYVERHSEPGEDADARPRVVCVALGEDGQLVETENVDRDRRRRRIEPTV